MARHVTWTRRGLARCVLAGAVSVSTLAGALLGAGPAGAATSSPSATTPASTTTPTTVPSTRPSPATTTSPSPTAPTSSPAVPTAPTPGPSPAPTGSAAPSGAPTPTAPGATPSPSATGSPAATASPSATGSATATPSATASAPPAPPAPTPEPGAEEALTREQVAAQVAAAAQLRAQLSRTDARLAAVVAKVGAISTQVSAALQVQRAADQAASQALQAAQFQQSRLARLRAQVGGQQDELGRWARTAYAAGGVMTTYEGWVVALQNGSGDDVAHDLMLLDHVGVLSNAQLERLQSATLTQKAATDAALTAVAAARLAQQKATAAKAKITALLDVQRRQLAALQTSELVTVNAATLAGIDLGRSSAAAAIAARAQLAAVLAARRTGGPVPLDPDACRGLDLSGYANGQIPAAALCPLWGSPQDLLRADAAAAFRDMSKAYATQFGRPICVTDSYRSRSEQVVVYAQKPNLAARPGTSNHGWGTATDLCGGIQSFATVEHLWMLTHAGLYGWFHPSWAEPTGSKPEPWHWEYAG